MEEFEIIHHWRQKVLVRNGKRCTPNAGEVLKTLFSETLLPVSPENIIKEIWGASYPIDRTSLRLVRTHVCMAKRFLKDSKSSYTVAYARHNRLYRVEKS